MADEARGREPQVNDPKPTKQEIMACVGEFALNPSDDFKAAVQECLDRRNHPPEVKDNKKPEVKADGVPRSISLNILGSDNSEQHYHLDLSPYIKEDGTVDVGKVKDRMAEDGIFEELRDRVGDSLEELNRKQSERSPSEQVTPETGTVVKPSARTIPGLGG